MKTAAPIALLGTVALTTARVAAASFPHATPHEFHLTADLDGDGRGDLVIVDRSTGVFRAGYQTAPGVHTWAAARPTGIENVTGVGAGTLFNLTAEQLAVTSPDANRIHLVDAPTPGGAVSPVIAYPSGMLPRELAVIEVGSAGNTAHEDLFISARLMSPPNGERLEYLRNNAGTVIPLAVQPSAVDLSHLRATRLQSPGPVVAAGLLRSPDSDRLQVWDPSSGAFAMVASATYPAGSTDGFAVGRFGAGRHLVLWRTGSPELRTVGVTGDAPAPPVLGAPMAHDLGMPVRSVQVIDSVPARFVVLGADGSRARVYGFDGATLSLQGEWVADGGKEFSGMLTLPDGSFHLLDRPAGGGASTGWKRFAPSGGGYTQTGSGELPALNRFGTAANLFLFAQEPFVSPRPHLLATLNAADWSSGLNLGGANIQVNAERLGTTAQGLDNPTARNLGPKPVGAAFGLVNQYREPISITSFQPAVGSLASEVRIQPPAGPQRQAIVVRLETTDPTHIIQYRIAGGAWSTAVGSTSFAMFQDGTVDYFSRPPAGNARSPLQHAAYAFPAPPALQDSDADGVPDFVEIGKGLDPNGGPDSDGDGYTDYTELLGGPPMFDPLNVNRPPPGSPQEEERSAFDLAVSPRPVDGPSGLDGFPAVGQAVSLHDLPGGLLGRADTAAAVPGALTSPAALITDAPANNLLGLLSVSTEPHFRMSVFGPDPETGRELLALLPVPDVIRPPVAFTPGPGPLPGQADDWITAAQTAAAGVTPARVNLRLGVPETLGALLLERKLHDVLVARGTSGLSASNRLTLFPFRANDVLRRPLTAEVVDALPALGPGGSPAWSLTSLHQAISNGLPTELLALGREVYRISALSNNIAPGRFPLPVDTLRTFLESGVLHSNYAAAISLNSLQVVAAHAESIAHLAGLAPRPTNSFDLEVAADSFQTGCTRLYEVGNGTPWNLFEASGVPYKFPPTFSLIPGSRVRVLAFTDFTDPCPGDDLQVLHATLTAIPAPSLVDLDGDLLPDDWECLFLAGDGDPNGDDDADGASNLQEYLDETDPNDSLFVPPVIVDLSPPVILIELLPGEVKELKWQFPAAYAHKFKFSLLEADELGEGFQPTGIDAVAGPGGQFSLLLPAVQKVRAFYVVVQQLR